MTVTDNTSTATVRTYAFENEDHTLGNVLRYALMKHRDVEGAGYNIPHPSEAIMNVWVQTRKGTTSPDDALEESLSNVEDMCEHLSYVYAEALKDFKEKQRQESSGKSGALSSTRKKAQGQVEVDAEADVEMADADATSAAQRCATNKATIVEGQEDAAEKAAEKKKKKKKKKDHKED